MCILVVEDEPLIRENLCEALEDAGFEVVEAASGVVALELLNHFPRRLSALVTDLHMPGGVDGGQVAERARVVAPGVPVVIVSGRPDLLQPDWRGRFNYVLLRKPFRLADMVSEVRALVRSSDTGRRSGRP